MSSSRYTRIGIVGAGQLGRMLALSGYPLGLRCAFLDPNADAPGAQVGPLVRAALDDTVGLARLASRSDVLTFDWENIAAAALAPLAKRTTIRPSPAALQVSQDRLHEKRLFTRLGIPTAAHAAVGREDELRLAVRRLGLPGVLKTRRLGYDGKGQFVIRSADDVAVAWRRLGADPLIYEAFQPFSREVSIIGVRAVSGEFAFYPLSVNTHANGTLRYCVAPYRNRRLTARASLYLERVMNALRYVGVLALEFFVVRGKLIANEMAPRVHNSGHWTIEGCVTSQFENHLRAICEMPLGSTRALGHAAMINFLGRMPARDDLLRIEDLSFHDYGKTPRAGRKLGHCTILKNRAKDRNQALKNTLKLLGMN